MNLFICKCKDDDSGEKNALDLLDIKNLEKSIKKEEKTIYMKKYYNLETHNNNDIIINNLTDELAIIDYPYKQEKKPVDNSSHIQLIKSNIINKNNKLFNNRNIINIKEIKKESDINSSSLSNGTLIIDDIDYLNDEDNFQINKEENKKIILKPIQLQKKKINSNKNITKSQNNRSKLNKKINIKNYISKATTKDSKNKIFHNESFRSGTTEVSTLKKSNKNKNKRIPSSEKNEHSLINNRLNKNLIDYKEFKNLLNKTFEEFSKSNRKNFLSAKKSVKNYFKNKKILFNDNSIRDIKQKQTKEKNIKNDITNKRINKRKVLFKKINLNYSQIK